MKNSLKGFKGNSSGQNGESANLMSKQWKLSNLSSRKKKDWKVRNQEKLWHTIKWPSTHILAVLVGEEGKKEKGKKNIWRSSGFKLPKSDEKCEHKHLRHSTNSK